MLPQDAVVALKMENTISGWLSSGKLVAPKRDNIQIGEDRLEVTWKYGDIYEKILSEIQ